MENNLLLCILVLIPAFASSDFLLTHVRNIKKRNADNDLIVNGIEIYSMKIDSKVTSRFAHNVITSRAVNRGNVSKEVFFDVELPKTAFITNFSMTIDGVTYPGTIKEKEAAKKQYEKAVSRGQTAGLVKASGRKTEKFTVSVNIKAASKVTFELTYEELLKRQFGKYEMFIKVKPKQLVKDFEIEVDIFEPQGITELEAEGTFITNELQNTIKKTFSGKKGHISFKPTLDQQRTCANCSQSVLDGDFTVKYDVKRTTPDNLQIVNGYFVHFFAPTNLPKLSKNIIFVLDTSGSMYGREIEQTKEALLKILDDIKEDDFFNFILFDSEISTWKETLIKATPENLDEARKFVQRISVQGMTNLHGGLMRGIDILNAAHEENLVPRRSASIIIMLTDGHPNVGVSNTQEIEKAVKKAIDGKYTLYNLGFGSGVDYGFLERMALENKGLARRIYPDSDAALQLQADNALSYTTQQGAEQTAQAFQEQQYIFGEYIERLWAYLTIEQLLEKRITATGEEKENLTAQALALSLKYKFVTPLTSMVVTKPEENDNEEGIADKPTEAEAGMFTGPLVASPLYHTHAPQPTWYTSVDGDPHFIISVPQKKDAICFNINENPGMILNLINDPVTGITVNGELIGDKRANSDAKIQNSYFGKLGIANKHLDFKLTVTPETITIQNGDEKTAFTWLDSVTLKQAGLTLIINRKKNLVLSMGSGVSFVVVLHQVWKKHPLHQDFLGLYTLKSDKLSEQTHGLLGQFFQPIDFTILEIHPGSDPKKPDATMIVKNNELIVTRGWQKDYRRDPKHGVDIPCWFVHDNGAGLIDGVHTDYIVSSLF
ncbi:inter-alpha-trypsin inhibitor heavy chain H3-like isoform X3 [Corvus hawaiiensis]|uniref:inter-alpha-trypsin inhibitor heavy chain H3-like isoform X3 n=1 Tax=Corvus hawaiiensis TaxID=134902 RepID=UPI0020198E96|nr:inter-alpha-trypsin inhibitor heavy chain H3-like isoform X3 [Corvus hawaiiensis]